MGNGALPVRGSYHPFLSNGGTQPTFCAWGTSGTALPGWHSGDQVHKVKEKCRATFLFTASRAKALVNLGVTAFEAGDSETATELFIKAAAEDPTHATALQNLRALGVPGY